MGGSSIGFLRGAKVTMGYAVTADRVVLVTDTETSAEAEHELTAQEARDLGAALLRMADEADRLAKEPKGPA